MKFYSLLIFILIPILDTSAVAEQTDLVYLGTTSSEDLEPPKAEHKQTQIEVGFRYFQYDFKEQIPPPKKSMETGSLPGIQLAAEHFFSDEVDASGLQAKFEYASGTIKYDGSLQTQTGEYAGDAVAATPTQIYDIQSRYVHNIEIDYFNKRFDVLIGYGYHRWFRGTDGSPGGYDVDYTWHYVPIGVRADLFKNDAWSIRLQGDLKLIFSGMAKASMSQVDPQLSDMALPLGSGTAVRIEVATERRLPGNWSVKIAPWYEQTNISRGKWVQSYRNGQPEESGLGKLGAYEPASITHVYGGEFNVIRSF